MKTHTEDFKTKVRQRMNQRASEVGFRDHR